MEADILDSIDPRVLGRQLQQARIRKGLTQDSAARTLGVARTTITAIEKGQRRPRPAELIKLAETYERDLGDFVRSRPIVGPFKPQFRAPTTRRSEDEASMAASLAEIEDLLSHYLELEQLTKAPLPRKFPPEYRVDGLKPQRAGEFVALEERNRLGLGDGPIPALRSLLEQDVGIRVFYLPLRPTTFCAVYVYEHQVGACIAVNRLHPEERRRWSLAHDYWHFLVDRFEPTVYFEDAYRRVPRTERIADDFARHFLMPASGLTRRVNDILRAEGTLTIADLCTLAHHYGVSVAALTLHLEDLALIPTGTWDKMRRSDFKVRQAQKQLHLSAISAYDDRLPRRYQYLALTALEQELITEGQFARYLGVDRLQARRIAELLRGQDGDFEGIPTEDHLTPKAED